MMSLVRYPSCQIPRSNMCVLSCRLKGRTDCTVAPRRGASMCAVVSAPESSKTVQESPTPLSEDFSKWYLDVVRLCQLADYGPVRGTMVMRPYGYAIWELTQRYLDSEFKRTGHENVYFPQMIPLSFLSKEADHVEGFAPELALVTKGGGKDLEEPLVVRPTSETMVNHMFSQWIQSYRDLPLLYNQWANVHRWEMRTRPFIRSLEFLWQEGHTAHATAPEATEEASRMLDIYAEFAREQAAMPVIKGRKSTIESFAGAKATFTMEAMMLDRRALQAGTTHDLGDNFARAFETKYLNENNEECYVHQSSWGVSTRIIGGVIMTHGDDQGLRLPPNLAPVQVVIVPVVPKPKDREAVLAQATSMHESLHAAGVRVKVDDLEGRSPGWKFNFWEMKGVPVRLEVGPRDVAKLACVLSRRDKPGKEGKQFGVSIEGEPFVEAVREALCGVQAALLAEAEAFRDANIVDVTSYEELKAAVNSGKWARGGWAGSDKQERQVKEDTGATLRCFPFEQPEGPHVCFMNGSEAQEVALFARAY